MGLTSIVETAPGIRTLGDPALAASIARVLAELPDGDLRAATIDIGADSQGIIAVGAVKLGKQWSVTGAFDKRYKGDWGGRVSVRWAGK